MKSLCQLSVLYILIDVVICQQQRYQWACTDPDVNGQWYIPSVRTRDPRSTSATPDNELYIYRVPTLDTSCYGPVTAIEYCYRYRNNAGSGQPTFNWTVLILEDSGNNFMINRVYTILSCLPEDSENCTNDGQLRTCCDRTNIEVFDLPMSNFAFGVTESAQGNTHGATLLGFADALPQYRVDVLQFTRAEVTLSIGSTIRNRSPSQRGIRMLWFVIGTSPTESLSTTVTMSTSSSIATTEPLLPTDADAQISSLVTSHHTTGIDNTQATGTSILQDNNIMVTELERQEERNATAESMASILTSVSVGSVIGAVILLSAIAILILIMAYLVWKCKKKDSRNGREMRISVAEKTITVDIEVDTNPSYIALVNQITIENNVAYGEVTVNQDGDGLYEIMDPPIEDSTTQLIHDKRSGENDYDIIF